MPPEKAEEVREWLRKASHDLMAARRLLEGDAPLPDVAVYHCQQAGEKALKAYLTASDRPFEKTHSLVELVQEASMVNEEFVALKAHAVMLTPYASRFRYPGVFTDPDLSEARDAIQLAAEVLDFVLARITDLPPSSV